MSACESQIDNSGRKSLARIFNLGFRRGANDRALQGLSYGYTAGQPLRESPAPPPAPPDLKLVEQKFWETGYATGWQIGASDRELAEVEIPGACGMISGLGEEILELMGFFRTAA